MALKAKRCKSQSDGTDVPANRSGSTQVARAIKDISHGVKGFLLSHTYTTDRSNLSTPKNQQLHKILQNAVILNISYNV
jgi:hypothetical protein